MDCRDVEELLPFYLNDSLEEPERGRLAGHLETCTACRAALRDTGLAFDLFGAHLPTDVMVQWVYEDKVPGWPNALITGHLEDCAACNEEVRVLRQSHEGLATTEAPAVVAGMPWWTTWLAAVAVLALGLGWWQSHRALSRARAVPDAPRVDYLTLDLLPREAGFRAPAGGQVLPASAGGVVLTLRSEIRDMRGPYRLEVRNTEHRVLWQADALPRGNDGFFTLVLPQAFLDQGPLELQLYVGDAQLPAEHYDVRPRARR